MKKNITCLALVLVAAACLPERKPQRAALGVAAIDSSGSTPRDACAEAAAMADELLYSQRARAYLFSALVSGGSDTDGTPVVIVPWTRYEPQPSAGVFEGQDAERRRREAWLSSIEIRCREKFVARDGSPIFQLVGASLDAAKAKLSELRAEGWVVEGARVWLHTDLREGSDSRIRGHLYSTSKKKLPDLPTLDRGDVAVVVCLGDHRGSGAAVDPERLKATWTTVLGLPPETPFDTSCPTWAGPSTARAR